MDKKENIKGLPSEVRFNKNDWAELLEIQEDKDSKIISLSKKLEDSNNKFDNLVQALKNTYNLNSNIPDSGGYEVFIRNDEMTDNKPVISFIKK